MTKDEAIELIRHKFAKWQDIDGISQARDWLSRSYVRITNLFSDKSLRDFVFEPFLGVLDNPSKSVGPSIYTIITQVALVNAVLAGLPGKMGVGVFVSMGLEAWMAYRIARHVGIEIERPADVFNYLSVIALTIVSIGWGFSALLNVVFSLVSLLPSAVPATVITQFVVTDIFGVLALVAFTEVKEGRSFNVPIRLWKHLISQIKELLTHHFTLLRNLIDPETIKQTGIRAWTYLNGDIPVDARNGNGEVFATVAMLYLVSERHEALEGPLSENFLHAIRLRWSAQLDPEATVSEISEHFRQYDADALAGAANTIKGKMFELMVEEFENGDGDNWSANLHTEENFPGSDIVFTSEDGSQVIEVSLKAVSAENTQLIESALQRYPDTPILTTDEVAAIFEDNQMVQPSGIRHEDLSAMTEKMLEELIEGMTVVSPTEVVVGGATVGAVGALWPFAMAFMRGKISQDRLTRAFERVMGDAGVSLASRVSYSLVFGPVFAWYLLARGIMGIVKVSAKNDFDTLYVSYGPRQKQT